MNRSYLGIVFVLLPWFAGCATSGQVFNVPAHQLTSDSPQEVIDAFNTVYPGNRPNYNALKDEFEDFNEQGCPLNNSDGSNFASRDESVTVVAASSDASGSTEGTTVKKKGKKKGLNRGKGKKKGHYK